MAARFHYGIEFFRLVCGSVHVHLWAKFFSPKPRFVEGTHLGAAQVFLNDWKERPRGPCFQSMQHGGAGLLAHPLEDCEIVPQKPLLNNEGRRFDALRVERRRWPHIRPTGLSTSSLVARSFFHFVVPR